MSIFNHTYEIKGRHSDLVRKITASDKLNCRNIDVFFISIALGISRHLKADIDINTKTEPAKIDVEQMVRFQDDIEFFYKLLMLTDKSYCPSPDERCNKAFRYLSTDKAEKDELYFSRVMLGGLEFLYEQIIENTTSKRDIFNNICDFMEIFEI